MKIAQFFIQMILSVIFVESFVSASECSNLYSVLSNSSGDTTEAGSIAELSYGEWSYLKIINRASPASPLEFQCLIDHIEVFSTNGVKTFSNTIPFIATIPAGGMSTYPLSSSKLVDPAWTLDSKSTDEIEINLKIVYRKSGDIVANAACVAYAGLLDATNQIDEIKIRCKHYGVYFLVDIGALFDNTIKNRTFDFFGGIFNTLQYTTVDLPLIYKTGEKTASPEYGVISAPILNIQSRKWYANFDVQYLLVKSLKTGTESGKGLAIGIWKPPTAKQSLVKIGMVFLDNDPHASLFLGISLTEIAKIASGNP